MMKQLKNSWPDLTGRNVEDAKREILQQDSNINVVIVTESQPLTRDYRMDRVRIFVDQETKQIVQYPPRRG